MALFRCRYREWNLWSPIDRQFDRVNYVIIWLRVFWWIHKRPNRLRMLNIRLAVRNNHQIRPVFIRKASLNPFSLRSSSTYIEIPITCGNSCSYVSKQQIILFLPFSSANFELRPIVLILFDQKVCPSVCSHFQVFAKDDLLTCVKNVCPSVGRPAVRPSVSHNQTQRSHITYSDMDRGR